MRRVSKTVPPQRQILKDISLSFFPGAKIGVLGLNGAGKSTLLRIMAGLDTNFSGEAFAAKQAKVGYLPQEPQLDESKTVAENVMEGLADLKALVDRFNEVSMRFAEDLGEGHPVHDPNLGGTVSFDWGSVKLVQAFHSNTMPGSGESPFSATYGVPVGQAAGLVIRIEGVTVYHAGDTCLFGDMALIGKRESVDVAILPIGGHYTMDRHDAAYAAELVGAGTVIPCHYNTFPPIETDVQAFKQEVESATSSKVAILEPGGTWSS